ncbi:MAG: hypothetical protein ACSHXF_07740 [Aquaticitalea sp.]
MKHLCKKLLLFLAIAFLIGCNKDEDGPREPYYQFSNDEKLVLIKYDYKPDQIITYENQENERIEFKVISNERLISESFSVGTFSGGGGIFENSYDNKIIRIEIIGNSVNTGTSGDYSKVNYIFSKNKNTFNNGINFPLWNVTLYSFIDEIQNPVNIFMNDFNNIQKSEMTVNGHLFTKVVTVNSGSDESKNGYEFGLMTQNINRIFYDYDFGIIQFNDVEGNEWKLIYPE